MPIDARIPLQGNQPEPLINMFAKMQSMRGAQQENQLRQAQMGEYQRKLEDQNALRSTLAGFTPDMTPEAQVSALQRGGHLAEGRMLAESFSKTAKDRREEDAAALAAERSRLEIRGQVFNSVAATPTLEAADAAITYLLGNKLVDPAKADEVRAQIQANPTPENIRALAQRFQAMSISAKDKLEQDATAARDAEAARSRGVTEANEAARLRNESERLELERRRLAVDEDTRKRNNDPVFQQQMAQARATGEAIGKGDVAAQQALPGALASAESAVNIINKMVGQEAVVKDGKVIQAATKPHPGFAPAVGAGGYGTFGIPGIARFVPGTDAANFMGYLDQINGAAFLQAYTILKGTGPIATKEGERATAAVTRMKTSLSEDEFITAAREFQDAIRKTAQAAQKKAGGALAGAAAPAAAGGAKFLGFE
jgi:hypothetical protein